MTCKKYIPRDLKIEYQFSVSPFQQVDVQWSNVLVCSCSNWKSTESIFILHKNFCYLKDSPKISNCIWVLTNLVGILICFFFCAWITRYLSISVVFLQKSNVDDRGFVWWGEIATRIWYSLKGRNLSSFCRNCRG